MSNMRTANKMKLAFIGDIHIDDKNPKFRIDDYCMEVAKNLAWILKWCRDNEVDKIILLGDVFHRKEVGGRCRNMVISLLKKHHSFPGAPDILCTIGNHDTGNDLNNLNHTTLYTLIKTNLIKVCDYHEDTRIAFAHNSTSLDASLKQNGLNHQAALIWSVHGSLDVQESSYAINFNNISIKGPCELVVCGHIHSSYETQRSDGIRLINPGHIGRNAFLPNIKTHVMQFLVVNHNGDHITSHEYVPIKIAKPYTAIFDLEKIQIQNHLKKQVKTLIQNNETFDLDLYGIENIIELAKKQKMSSAMIDLLTQYLEEAQNYGNE